jgi:ABC-2 type transport system ATP-binding protein
VADLAVRTRGLTKRYGHQVAVDAVDLAVPTGAVYGFLGPNGSGKTSTIRVLLGLAAATAGDIELLGEPMPARWRHVLPRVGALVEGPAFYPWMSGPANLVRLDAADRDADGRTRRTRVHEAIERVGLTNAGRKKVKAYSLGMKQRLGIAAALLGDPQVLLFDEPVNGLDPEGILWVRNLMKGLASEGRTVFVSSHLMSEMALTAEHLIVIGRGQLMADTSVKEFIAQNSVGFARVRTPDGEPQQQEKLRAAVQECGGQVQSEPDGALRVSGLPLPKISDLAHEADVRLWELSPHQASLEEAYMRLTQGAVDYRSTSDPALMQQAQQQAQQQLAQQPEQFAAAQQLGVPMGAPAPGMPGAPGMPAPGVPGAPPQGNPYAAPAPGPGYGPPAAAAPPAPSAPSADASRSDREDDAR